jgi:hypothetical protein
MGLWVTEQEEQLPAKYKHPVKPRNEYCSTDGETPRAAPPWQFFLETFKRMVQLIV